MLVFLRELQPYSDHELKKKLELNTNSFNEFIEMMKNNQIIELDKNSTYSFQYVGLIGFKNRVIFFIPKYSDGSNKQLVMNRLINLLNEYSKRENIDNNELETLGSIEEEEYFNYFTVIDFLFNDYLEHGLYSNEIEKHERNGEGEINWNKTIEENTAYLTNDQVVYFDVFTEKKSVKEEDFFRRIHKYVLTECTKCMKKINLLNVLGYPYLTFDIILEEIGNIDEILYSVEKEMNVLFDERKFKLMQAIYFFLSREKGFETDKRTVFFGTRKFHIVWEKVCAFVLGNEYRQLKGFIPKPVWTDFNTNNLNRTETLEPDIVRKFDKKQQFFIFDAKYYVTRFSLNGDLKNNYPGIGDITKQYLYEKAFINSLNVQNYERYNAFLLPTDENDSIFGKVHLSFLAYGLSDIFLIRLNDKILYEDYINRKQFGENFFDKVRNDIVK